MHTAGFREGDKEGSHQEARQALNSGVVEAQQRTSQGTGGLWLGDEREKGQSASLKDHLTFDQWTSGRHEKGAWTVGLETEGKSRKFTFSLEY